MLAKIVDIVARGPPVVGPGDDSNKSLLLLKTGVGVEIKLVVISSTSWLLLLGLTGEGEDGEGEKTGLEVASAKLGTLLDTNPGIMEVGKGIRYTSSFTVVDGTTALVVSGRELEGEIASGHEEGEGDGVKTMDEGRKVVWMAGRGVVSSDGGGTREGEAVVSMMNDDVMSKTLGSSGRLLPLPVIPALGGEEGKKCHTPNHNYLLCDMG